MAKQMDEVRLLVTGDENGATQAKFVYTVCDDGDLSMKKVVHYNVDTPVFSIDTVADFFDGYVDVFKADEGIS